MEERLRKIMVNLFGICESEINDESSNKNIKKWDSLKHMELILAIEEDFNLPKLEANDIVQMTTVAKIKNILRARGVII